MLTVGVIGTGQATGEVRSVYCKLRGKPVAGADQSEQGGDDGSTEAIITSFRLPVGPEAA